MTDLHRVRDAILRQDLPAFIHRSFQEIARAQPYDDNWHVQAMAWNLQQCMEGRIRRLLITLPPRHLKSICASVAFPAWVLGRDPTQRIVCVSYSHELAGKHAQDCRAVMRSPWYRQVFPATRLSREKNAELDFVTTGRGYRFSTSVGGTLTGRGGGLIIIDDPLKPDEAMSEVKRAQVNDWFDRTLSSRLDDQRSGVIILIMQRLHVEDLAGHVLSQGPWVHLNLPAIAENDADIPIGPEQVYHRHAGELLHPSRQNKEVLDAQRQALGSFNFAAQYQQCPVPAEGEIIHWDWFQFYDSRPCREPGDLIVQSWDTAAKAADHNDYSVGTTWLVKGNEYYLLDLLRVRFTYPELEATIIQYALHHKAGSLLIEDHGSGTGLIQDLRRARIAGLAKPIAIRPTADKLTRMHVQSARIEAGHVFLPRRAAWLEPLRLELLQFPKGRYDDQVDSISQFLNWIEARKRGRIIVQDLSLWL